MFRIRRVLDDFAPANAAAVRQVQAIMRERFPNAPPEDSEALPAKLRDPLKHRFQSILLVAEGARGRVRGFALALHAPDLRFVYLDYIASSSSLVGGGVGGALYQRVREEARDLDAVGLFFECLPDDERLSPEPAIRRLNAARLRFYETYGARPIVGTAYETPVKPGTTDPPYLVLDPLGRAELPGRDQARAIVAAILERKYGEVCPPDYRAMVVESFRDDPVRLRPPRHSRKEAPSPEVSLRARRERIKVVVTDAHAIHHVRERGYVEAPVRVSAILRALEGHPLFELEPPRRFPDGSLDAAHARQLVQYLRRACEVIGTGPSVYPYVFPVRNRTRPPKELPLRSGYFCIDTFTPLNANAYLAARRAVDCALTGAELVLEGQGVVYVLVRPPGHHAERHAFGGFCYFNNSAVAAAFLARYGRVAVLDVDYHHGNGTQDIFYDRSDVLTVSIHGHPSFAYPYFSGFRSEQGQGEGLGYNLNLPLPEVLSAEAYRATLEVALRRVARFDPDFLVLAVGFDTARGDPTGSWSNVAADFRAIGKAIGRLGLPTLAVQEGGYRIRSLGRNARNFFEGLALGSTPGAPRPAARRDRPRQTSGPPGTSYREEVRARDVDRVRGVVAATAVFSPEEVEIAGELVRDRLSKGQGSGYEFILAEDLAGLVGFACFGPIPGTVGRFDLYWVVVRPGSRRLGIGRDLLRRSEQRAAEMGAARMYVDTSTSEHYADARAFYRHAGYRKVAELPGFFRDGDGKVIYAKELRGLA